MGRQIAIASPALGEEEAEAAYRVVQSGGLASGPETASAEVELAAALGATAAILVSNGTVALELALRAAGVQPDSEVVTTPFTFFATCSAILSVGARPVFADIDPLTYNIDPEHVERCVSSATSAILPVHLFGRPADLDPLRRIAEENCLALVEDAAQAIGGAYREKPIGSTGWATFSFYGSKNVTCGEGGAVAVPSEEAAETMRMLRNHGSRTQYVHEAVSGNYRLSDVQAAILRVQLGRLESITARRREVAKIYRERLADAVVLPCEDDDVARSSHHQFTIRVDEQRRDDVIRGLAARGVAARVYYPIPVHLQPVIGADPGAFPVAELAAREVVSLPIHTNMSEEDVDYVADQLLEVMAGSD